MRWASTMSSTPRVEDALDEALAALIEQLGGEIPDLLFAFATPAYTAQLDRLVPHITRRAPDTVVLACVFTGVIGGGQEHEDVSAVVLFGATLPGVSLFPFHLNRWGDWFERVPDDLENARGFILLADPFTFPTDSLLGWLQDRYPDSTAVGGLASGGFHPGDNRLICQDVIQDQGAVGVALCGDIVVEAVVAQCCRPIGTPMFITRSDPETNYLYELDARPVLDVVEEICQQLSPSDRALIPGSLFIGLGMEQGLQEYRQGDFVVRRVRAFDREVGALHIGGALSGQGIVQLQLLDPTTAVRELEQKLAQRTGERRVDGALLFSSMGRGKQLYGRSDQDSDIIRANLGNIPIGGGFSNGEIGPGAHRSFIHGFSSCVTLFSTLSSR